MLLRPQCVKKLSVLFIGYGYHTTLTSCGCHGFSIHWQSNCMFNSLLTHWGWVTHICFNKIFILGSDNGLSPGRRQAIIKTNAGILLIWPLGTNFSEILIEINTFSFKKMHLKMSSGKRRPFCLGLNELKSNNKGYIKSSALLALCERNPPRRTSIVKNVSKRRRHHDAEL